MNQSRSLHASISTSHKLYLIARNYPTTILLLAIFTTGAVCRGEDTPVSLFFSPNGGCRQAIIDQINSAESEILVAAYSLTSDPIAESLIAAARRGVRVHVILDRRAPSVRNSQADRIFKAGIPTRVDRIHQLMHQKTIIIDRRVLITGSYNFTDNAEKRNSEILAIIACPKTASKAAAQFETLHSLSTEVKSPRAARKPKTNPR